MNPLEIRTIVITQGAPELVMVHGRKTPRVLARLGWTQTSPHRWVKDGWTYHRHRRNGNSTWTLIPKVVRLEAVSNYA